MNRYISSSLMCVLFLSALPVYTTTAQAMSVKHNEIVLTGWMKQDFVLDASFLEENKGRMYEVFDEYVGVLLDKGLDHKKTVWLKPTYGNQNILWTSSFKIGDKLQLALSEYKKTNPEILATYYKGDIKVSDVNWVYSGYTDDLKHTNNKLFQDFIFTCKSNKVKGISVFYWGDEMLITANKNDQIIELLEKLASACK